MKKSLTVMLMVFSAGCATIPRETVVLSSEMGVMLSSAKTAHYNLLDQYAIERRERIDDFMQNVWIPRFIGTMAKDGDLWGKTCKRPNTIDATIELQGFVDSAARRIAAKRKELTDALDDVLADLREAVRAHYDLLESSNRAVTRNLESVQRNDEVTKTLLKKNRLDPEMLTPLRDVSRKLDVLFK